ncbi:hypothetical protein CFOL_v3_17185 [Cephalotus follicularis]|uniref:SWIM-type domain-containing protein n=1 Tax=Cephalotus follicularis TaxID=3775 RepID=A0A1Q3C0Q9_CEPFO|nr:hypothetical protein CFOL_v3_17185 [Cephalotus follicularis]
MARWDAILSLPVQSPPTLEFSSADLVWSKVEGWRDNMDKLALIPFARVDDFVRGESANKDCPTRFHVEARRRRSPRAPYKPKVDGVLEYILYWCSFGPDDHRKGGDVRPSRIYVRKKNKAGRPNTKRGCTCHFIVKRLIAEPSVALILYNQDKHVDKKGLPCHGSQDKKAAGTRAMFAPYISEELRLRVLSLLYVGVSVETIMQRHNESVEKQGGPNNRDDLLTHRYVRRLERSIRRSTYELDPDDAGSISMWVESHQSHVFFYKHYSESDPFTLGIQTEWQLQQMIRFGNRSLLASDSRFGTNKLKCPVHSLIVFNSDNKAIPVAWIIAPRFVTADTNGWMRALYNRVRNKDPTWKLAGFIVDDPLADILTIRDVFECSVLISFWRVRHAWHKNLVKRCFIGDMCIEISRRLGLIVDDICRGHGTVDAFEDFMEDFVDASDFMDYFKAIWYPRIGSWTTALKTFPLASQETCAAMEFYHRQLKLRLLNEKDVGVYQRTDWLVDTLGTKVHSYFWLDEYTGKDDFSRYWKDEWMSGLTSWRKALKIPDSDVVIEFRGAKVTDQLDRDKVYVVSNPGSQFGICDCSWGEMGYLCEHVIKVMDIFRKKGSTMPSISMLQYKQALLEMLHYPPHDSLIRDHAISLAVFVDKQLNGLLDFESQTTVDPIQEHAMDATEEQNLGADSANENRIIVNENPFTNEDVLFHNENIFSDSRGALFGPSDNVGGELMTQTVSKTGTSGHSTGEISCADMEVHPASICISPPRLLPVDEVISADVFSQNGVRTLVKDTDMSGNLPYKAGILSDKTTSTMSRSLESQAVDMTEKLHVEKENEAMELESEHETTSKNLCHTDICCPCGGDDNDKATLDPNLGDDVKAVNIIAAIDSGPSQCGSSMSSHSDNQLPIDAASQETGSFEKPLSNDKSFLTGSVCLEGAENGHCDNKMISLPQGDNSFHDPPAEGTVSKAIADVLLERSGSDKHQTDAGDVAADG